MGRVFLVEPTNKNLAGARQYGEIVVLLNTGLSADRVNPFHTEDYATRIRERLEAEKFDPKNDCFLCVGPMISIAIAFFVLSANFESVRALFFQANAQDYVLRNISTGHHCVESA